MNALKNLFDRRSVSQLTLIYIRMIGRNLHNNNVLSTFYDLIMVERRQQCILRGTSNRNSAHLPALDLQ